MMPVLPSLWAALISAVVRTRVKRSLCSRIRPFITAMLATVSLKPSHTDTVQLAAASPPLCMSSNTLRSQREMIRPSMTRRCVRGDMSSDLTGGLRQQLCDIHGEGTPHLDMENIRSDAPEHDFAFAENGSCARANREALDIQVERTARVQCPGRRPRNSEGRLPLTHIDQGMRQGCERRPQRRQLRR